MKMKELFKSSEHWTKKTNCRDRKTRVPITLSQATEDDCFCLKGAIEFCYPVIKDKKKHYEIEEKVWSYITRLDPKNNHIMFWNDLPERTFEDIQKLVNDLDI